MILLSIIFCSWAEECGAVHWGGTAQKLFHGDAGAERTLWHCSISGADWWLKVSNPLLLPLTSDWQLRLSHILSKRKLTERDKSLIITAWGSLVCVCVHLIVSISSGPVCINHVCMKTSALEAFKKLMYIQTQCRACFYRSDGEELLEVCVCVCVTAGCSWWSQRRRRVWGEVSVQNITDCF